ncbi:hypothetical protein AAF712_013339 [Marasmius tenuissimus]|uniref:E3 ubiquitin-protein ligase RNF220 middle domain-containing protein n=1 Tax=Marasmius tenuissimus TaxID=585030 RepID=A0ABR2ZF29_9AGAR
MAKGKEKAGPTTRTRKRAREESIPFDDETNAVAGPSRSRSRSVATTDSPTPDAQPVPKKSRHRAETRECPICHEPIPLRLLGKHAELESSRVQDIMNTVGSTEPLTTTSGFDLGFYVPLEETLSSTSTRRSAARARQTIHTGVGGSTSTITKTIQAIKRNRKQRHVKLREMTRDEEEGSTGLIGDIIDAHVDACLAHEAGRLAEERERQSIIDQEVASGSGLGDDDMMVDVDGEAVGYIGDVRGTGFHTRDRNAQDVDDEVDVDGDDAVVYGDAQFTEGDILPLPEHNTRLPEEVEGVRDGVAEDQQPSDTTLRDLVAEGKILKKVSEVDDTHLKARMDEIMGLGEADKMDLAILAARRKGNSSALIAALQNKITQLVCSRITAFSILI